MKESKSSIPDTKLTQKPGSKSKKFISLSSLGVNLSYLSDLIDKLVFIHFTP